MGPRWQSRRTCAHLLLQELQNYNLLLNNRWHENVGSHQKEIPHIQGQRGSCSKTVGGTKSCLESNPVPTRDTQEGSNKPYVHQDPGERSCDPKRYWHRIASECPEVSRGGMGQRWPAAGLGALSTAVPAWDLLKEVAIIFITYTIVWPRVK